MKSQRIAMTIDEFHLMPRKLGWKHEYWDDHAYLTPNLVSVVTTTVAVVPRPVQPPCDIRPVTEQDLLALFPAYVAAFADTIDYCDWSLAKVKSAARDNLAGFFAGKRGRPLLASQVAVSANEIVGAALIVEKKEGQPMLDLLFVVPEWHRKGVATAMVATALNGLANAGFSTLNSRFMLGNEESRSWHHRFGFVDESDLFLARTYYYHAHHEVERHETLGDLSPTEQAALVAECERWEGELDRLEAIAKEQGMAAVLPML